MISKLITEIKKKNAPIVVGLDPMMSYIPEHIVNKVIADMGPSLEAAGEIIWQYNKGIIDAVYDLVPAVKPQIAMYEQFGIPGLVAFDKTVKYCKEKGLIVIADAKRGDIGSTSKAYATAHLGKVEVAGQSFAAFDSDFVTVNPYLGSDGVNPFIDVCNSEDRGIFVLVKTSNPSSGEFQDRKVLCSCEGATDDVKGVDCAGSSRALYEIVGEMVDKWAESSMDGDYSNVGAVVGATYPAMGRILRSIMKKSYILVPGYGAQGGSGKDLAPFFNEDGLGAIVNSSRGIIAAYKNEKYAEYTAANYADASRKAVLDMVKDINESVGLT